MIRKGIAIVLILGCLMPLSGVSLAESVGYVTSTGLYIRATPSKNGKVLRCADHGEKLTILKEEGGWYYVRYNSVVSGYVSKEFVSKTNPEPSSASSGGSSVKSSESLPSRVSELGSAPATSKLGDRGNDVKKLQQALKIVGYYDGSCDGIFGPSTESSVKKFQKARGLSQDGVAGKTTVKILFGENAANDKGTSSSSASGDTGGKTSKSEKLDWYKDSVSMVIPKGTYVTIKDVRSGVTFRAKHLYGASHMDAEPLTKEDTAKLKKIYGGSWSWNRRPILILCSGRVFAASMNGMPHGEQSIYDNDFDGQFCIHFLNSKTHGTAKVDSDHQACINEAAKASW
ncbi:MAG: peptidoglycan-binding protein [Firmicutes bacterium]|nr:peptidoglycan-binding protein [Bacillota bacterium]